MPLDEDGGLTKETAKLYKSFMQAYVKRINDATYRVPIEGIRIGSAKYSRLAQINLKTRIITFSRFAIENVPERGRRYLVLHELAHVMEASHNKFFWQLVSQYERDYKEIGLSLDRAFKENVQNHEKAVRLMKRRAGRAGQDRTVDDGPRQLTLLGGQTGQSLIWTPDHGYVEPGSKRFGLHKDPRELFVLGDESGRAADAADEAYGAYEEYLDLKEQGIEQDAPCIFDEESAVDQAQDMLVYDDEEDFDLLYGTMSGGDD